jgi:hypothetical protein
VVFCGPLKVESLVGEYGWIKRHANGFSSWKFHQTNVMLLLGLKRGVCNVYVCVP